MRFLKKNYKIIIVTILLFGTFMLQPLTTRQMAMGKEMLELGPVCLPMQTVQGIIQSMLLMLSIMLVCFDYKAGSIIAISFIVMSVFTMLRKLIFNNETAVIPGICNSLISLFSVIFIGYQLKKRDLLAVKDDLTNLFNRRGLEQKAEHLASQQKLNAIAFIQIKDFRNINDNLGHEYGDAALCIISERMKTALAKTGIPAHIDGTEFAVAIHDTRNVPAVCNQIIEAITTKLVFEKNGVTINGYLSAFIGVAVYGKDTRDLESLMKYADIASYNAVKQRKDKVVFFSQEMLDESVTRAATIANVKESLENDYFYLVYQPQYQLGYKILRGFEALIRCKMPDGTFISPGEFIPIAEKTNLILEIDNYVLKRALTEFKPVLSESNNDFTLSVNVSAKSMSLPGFDRKIANLLSETGFPAENLEIEITEYSFSESQEHTYNNVVALRNMGVQIALDDFGTGYTSLEQLLKLPVNLLKVDKSLVDNIEDNRVNRDFIDSVIYMGHLIGCDVIAEGVESESQLQLLKDHNCDYVQGFVWSKPLPFDDAKDLVK